MTRKEALELLVSRTSDNGVARDMDIDRTIEGDYADIFEACSILGLSITANGSLYKTDKRGFLPTIMREIFDRRNIFKKAMIEAEKALEADKGNEALIKEVASLKAKQQAYKILANSGYGALANVHFTFFDYTLAMSITLSGQLSIKWVAKALNDYMNKVMQTEDKDYIIAVDTDSNYLNCGPLVEKYFPGVTDKEKIVNFLDAFADVKCQKIIDKAFADLAAKMNAFDPCLKMKREAIAESALWTGKKRYAMQVLDNEGIRFSKAKLKVTGLETKRSSVPEVCRNALSTVLNIILTKNEDELRKFEQEFRQKFFKMNFYDIARPSGMNGLDKYYDAVKLFKDKCPVHVKGAIVYNEWLKRKNLDEKYALISDGEKVKWINLKLPNRLRSEVISCVGKIPDELQIESMIDYQTQYEKTFLEPLKALCKAAKWELEKRHTLDDIW